MIRSLVTGGEKYVESPLALYLRKLQLLRLQYTGAQSFGKVRYAFNGDVTKIGIDPIKTTGLFFESGFNYLPTFHPDNCFIFANKFVATKKPHDKGIWGITTIRSDKVTTGQLDIDNISEIPPNTVLYFAFEKSPDGNTDFFFYPDEAGMKNACLWIDENKLIIDLRYNPLEFVKSTRGSYKMLNSRVDNFCLTIGGANFEVDTYSK